MASTWPSLIHRAHQSAQLLGEARARTWPSLVHRAHQSAQLLGEARARTWPSLVHRAHQSAQLLGEARARTWPVLVHRAHLSAQLAGEAMARTWPVLVHRAHLSVQLLGEASATTWPSLVHRAHLSARLLSEVVLAALLAVTLAFSWRDGVPSNEYVDVVGPAQSSIASMGKPLLPSIPPVVAPAPTAPPVQLLISSLNVHRPVEKVGVDRFGVMNLPVNAWNAGWFKSGPVPGAPGDAVIEGHAGYPGQPMIFGKLGTLRPGDRIVVVLSDGSRHLFIMVSMARVPVGSAPPGLASSQGPPRLTLITCTGNFDKSSYSYSERLVLEARYAGLV